MISAMIFAWHTRGVALIVDIHAHVIVAEVARRAAPHDKWRPQVTWTEGHQLVDFGGRTINAARREFVDIEVILAQQDKIGVDTLVLTPWSALFRYDADLDISLAVNRIQNDALAKIAQEHERIAALGTVPLQDSAAAVAELKRTIEELGLPGVEIGTNVNGSYLGAAQLRPFWAAAAALGAFIMIHPVPGMGGPTMREYYLWNAFGNPAETALAASHMILSGLLDEFPNLKICLLHGGGYLPYQIGRLDRAYAVRPEVQAKLSAPPSSYFKRFYFDTVTHSAAALSYLIDLVGVEHVLLGSDYPFDMGYENPAHLVEELPGLNETERMAILGGNAQRVLNL